MIEIYFLKQSNTNRVCFLCMPILYSRIHSLLSVYCKNTLILVPPIRGAIMQRPNLSDLTFESDSLSMAEDCISVLSVSSDNENIAQQTKEAFYKSPVLLKTSGEEILLLTELFLPAKRERYYIEKDIKDYRLLRKQEKYHFELREYYEELASIETQQKNDDLLKESQNYLRKKARKLEIEAQEYGALSEKWDFPDFSSPIIQMIGMENLKDRQLRKKGKVQRLIFGEKPEKSIKDGFLLPEKSNGMGFLHSLFDNIIQRPKISFSFNEPKKGQLKINPTLAPTHINLPKTPEKTSYFTSGAKINPFRFDPLPKPAHYFIHNFPNCHQISSLIFSEKTDPDHENIKFSLSRLFTIPINQLSELEEQESAFYSESEPEEAENILANKDLEKIDNFHHCKFVYKYHLTKKSWTKEELTLFHRPKINIQGRIQVIIDIDPVNNIVDKPNPNSYLQFPKYQGLTLAEGKFIICEYIEQFPLLIQNSGMASKICNYYTQYTNEEYMGEVGIHNHLSKYPSIRILSEGKNLAFFENNLFVAPIFYHPAQGRDFLLVRTCDGRWIGRIFSKVFTIGQQEPKVEVAPPKSKFQRELKDKHLVAAFFEKLFLNNGEISKSKARKIVDKMKYKKNLKKLLADIKIVQKDESWVCEKAVEKDDFQKVIQPEEFVCYEMLLAGLQKQQNLGISIMSSEKLLSSLLTLKKELLDCKVHQIAEFIEEQVALTPWNLTNSFLRGKKKSNFMLQGRADPTCGFCGYSFEVLSKYNNKDLSIIKEQIKKNVDKEIKILGNSWYKNDSSEDSEEFEEEPIDYSMFNENSNGINKESSDNDSVYLQGFIESLGKLKEPKPLSRKVLKRTIIYPLLSGGFKKVITYTEDPNEISNFVQKKHPVPKLFLKPKPQKLAEQDLKKQEEKEKQKQENRLKKQEEALKKKEERKLEKAKQKLLMEQEWKNLCIEKYNSGAVLFNTGTNANLRCGRCNMIGHVKSNKKLCPAYVEEKVDLDIDSKVVLNMLDIPQEPKKGKGRKKGKAPAKKNCPVLPQPIKTKSSRRGIDEYEQILVKLMNYEQDKEMISGPGGLLSLLEKSEKGHKWSINEFEESLKSLYNEDYEYIEDEIEELKFKQDLKVPVEPVKKPKIKSKVELIEDSETLIINTL